MSTLFLAVPASANPEDPVDTTGKPLCTIPGVVTDVTATFSENGYPSANACDGNSSTSWSNWKGDPKNASDTLTFELNDVYAIDRVNVVIPEGAPQSLTLQYLAEGDNWENTSAGTLTDFTHAQSREIKFDTVDARGLRLVMDFNTTPGGNNTYTKISELEIFTAITSPVTAVELGGSLEQRVYELGEDFNFAGITVNATLENGATIDLGTDSLTVEAFDNEATGLQEVTIVYDEAGVTATQAATVVVNAVMATDHILVDAADIDTDNVLGLTFKGFGMLSGNSTSALLLDYKAENPEQYEELIEFLFGGDSPIITHVKIEMGADRNTSTGPNVATMRTADEDANVTREPGFQIAADAKKYNPDLVVSLLRWCDPGWVPGQTCGGTNHQGYYEVDGRADAIYRWFKNTILAAHREYGYMVDYVNPDHNERVSNYRWVADFADRVANDTVGYDNGPDNPLNGWSSAQEEQLFKQLKMVISDEVGTGSFGADLYNNIKTGHTNAAGEAVRLQDVIDVSGYHYSQNDDGGGNFKKLALEDITENWNSEAQATFSNSLYRPFNNQVDPQAGPEAIPGTQLGGTIGPLEMANTFVKGLAVAHRTHVIYQPLIGSFYEGGQYSFKEVISARDPWSGYMHFDAGLNMLRHVTEFSQVGWENEENSNGIWRAIPQASRATASGTNPIVGRDGGPNYMTLASPDRDAFSTFIVNDSQFEQTFTIMPLNFEGFDDNLKLNVWETRAADDASGTLTDNYLNNIGALSSNDGVYEITVKPFSAVTVTTLANAEVDVEPLPASVERTVLDQDSQGGVIYSDDFDSYATRTVTTSINGHTESQNFLDSRGGEAGAAPLYTSDLNGAFEVVQEPSGNYVLRQQVDTPTTGVGSCWNCNNPTTSIGDYRWTNYKASADVRFDNADSENFAFVGARYINNQIAIDAAAAAIRITPEGDWTLTRYGTTRDSGTIDDFDVSMSHNLAIQVAGNEATAFIDGVEVGSFTDSNPTLAGRVLLGSGFFYTTFDNLLVETVEGYAPFYAEALDNMQMEDINRVTKLEYSGVWLHSNGHGMYVHDRTLSSTSEPGASVTYTFTGTGLDLLASSDGRATLDVTVDGRQIAAAAPTWSNSDWRHSYSLQGLPYGEHTVELALSNDATLNVDQISITSAKPTVAPDVTPLRQAVDAVANFTEADAALPADWDIFAANLDLARRILDADDAAGIDGFGVAQAVERLNRAAEPLIEGITVEVDLGTYQIGGELPGTVLIDGVDRPVTWDRTSIVALRDTEQFSAGTITGSAGEGEDRWYVVGNISVIVPENVVYVIDSGREEASSLLFDEVLALGQQLLNDSPDQPWDGVAEGKTWGYVTGGSGFEAGAPDDWGSSFIAADYNRPVVYSLTLPPGTYTVGTVQAPRNVTTAIYSEVSLGDTVLAERRNDVAEGPGRTILQTFTVPESAEGGDALVTVEFGTNGTSGYNARLALVWVAEVTEVASEADIAQLLSDLEAAESLTEDDYTQETWVALVGAMETARRVLELVSPTPEQVSAATRELSDAVAGLESVPTPEPTDPTDPTPEPTDPTDPTPEPTDPTDPTPEPTDPTDPTPEPTDPTDPTPEPSEHPTGEPTATPGESAKPGLPNTGAVGAGAFLASVLLIGAVTIVVLSRRQVHHG